MSHLFISYAHEDRGKARALAQALQQAHVPVWWDERLQLGGVFSEEIQRAIQESFAMLVLWSRHSVESEWVQREAQAADRLLPVLLDDVRPPPPFDELDCADLTNWRAGRPHREFDNVVRALVQATGRSGDVHAQAQDRETIFVQLEVENHLIRYGAPYVYVDGEQIESRADPLRSDREFYFDLTDGDSSYSSKLTVWVSAFRGSVQKMQLKVGGRILFED